MSIPSWFPQKQFESLRHIQDFHKISEGGIGEIYHATDTSKTPALEVVVKRLKGSFNGPSATRDKFLNEATILKQLRHPQIPTYIDGFVSDQECFYIMQYFRAIDLNKLLIHAKNQGVRLSKALSLGIAIRLLDALEYLHQFSGTHADQRSIVHGDIKPKNILVSENFEVILIDFSIAVFAEPPTKFIGGTAAYMPPEYFTGGAPTPQADFFSLSLTLFDLLAQRRLIADRKNSYTVFMDLLNREYLASLKKENLPKPLEKVLEKGLAFEPKDRFQNSMEFKNILLDCAKELDVDIMAQDEIAGELRRLSVIS